MFTKKVVKCFRNLQITFLIFQGISASLEIFPFSFNPFIHDVEKWPFFDIMHENINVTFA